MSSSEEPVASCSGGGGGSDDVPGASRKGRCLPGNDPRLSEILREYHRRNITEKATISNLLLAEHGIKMSARTVVRRRAELGLKASGRTTREMSEAEKRQLLLDQLAKDPGRTRGIRSIKEAIAREASVHLTRQWIAVEMRRIDPIGVEIRRPNTKRKDVVEAQPQGPHYAWTGYGYEKLSQIGFPIWCLRDSWTISWLGMWVLPVRQDRLAHTYRYLELVKTLEGMPMQGTVPEGKSKEVTLTYSLTHALREALTSEPAGDEPTVDRFLRRLDGVRAERGSAHLQLDWGDAMLTVWEDGKHIYEPTDPRQYELVQWLWSTLIQKELNNSRYIFNNHKSRRDRNLTRPTGVTPSIALALYAQHGGVNCLQTANGEVAGHLMEDIGGEDVVRFVSKAFERRAAIVMEAIGVQEVKLTNVWETFQQMLPLL